VVVTLLAVLCETNTNYPHARTNQGPMLLIVQPSRR